MGDSVKAYAEMLEEKEKYVNYVARDNGQYLFLLDFNDGKVYRYDISVLGNEQNGWNPDHESCEAFLYGAGHSIKDCEWMVTTNGDIEEDGITN
jgi:hypothetical protein